MARLLGVPKFRWFEVRTAPGEGWRRGLVRTASALVPYAICVALFALVYAIGGVPQPTTVVTVLPEGAALEAGMQDGDKVLVVGSVSVHTWDEARAQIQSHAGPVTITVERAGKRRDLSVTPRDRLIGVSPVSEMRRLALLEVASLSALLPLKVVSTSAESLIAWHQPKDLKGPVGIVRETGNAAKAGWLAALYFLGVLGSYFWPFVAALHVFDVVTGWTFRMTLTETGLREPVLRMARLRFSMHFSLGCWLAVLLAEVALAAEVPGSWLLVVMLVPGVWALWPLLWVSLRELSGNKAPYGMVLPALVPCGAPILGVWVAIRLRQEERRLRSHQPDAPSEP